jgi:hypothetical protein
MTWVAQSYRNIEISTKELEQYRCIQVVRGLFYLDNNAEQSARIRFNDGTTIREEQRKTLWDNGLWLASPPDFLFEGKLYPSENKQAFAVVPQIARLDYPIATRLLRPSKDRSVAVFFGFSPFPEKQRPDLQNSPGASLVLGNLEPGLELRFPTPQADAHKVNRSAYESEWFSFATKASTENDRVPFGISALVTETQDASEFLAFVAAVFQGAKDDITKQLQTAIVPTLAAEARESAQAAKENAQSKYDEAVASAMTALESCMTGTTNLPQLAARARITMRNVNQAARAAGINEKFSDKDFKGTSVTEPDPIKAACKAARDKLP